MNYCFKKVDQIKQEFQAIEVKSISLSMLETVKISNEKDFLNLITLHKHHQLKPAVRIGDTDILIIFNEKQSLQGYI